MVVVEPGLISSHREFPGLASLLKLPVSAFSLGLALLVTLGTGTMAIAILAGWQPEDGGFYTSNESCLAACRAPCACSTRAGGGEEGESPGILQGLEKPPTQQTLPKRQVVPRTPSEAETPANVRL